MPQTVKNSFEASLYAKWKIDDVDMLERPDAGTIYVLDVENGEQDADLHYTEGGILIKEVTDGRLKEKKDIRYVSRGFIAGKGYEIEEVSGSRPSELMVADGWVSDPQTDAQKEYCEAESVYRQFVYDNYTKAEADLADLIDEVFWKDYETEKNRIYRTRTHWGLYCKGDPAILSGL